MASWTDNFTHDYFADDTYTLIGATAAPTEFGGTATVPVWCIWEDERTPATVIDMTLAVAAGSSYYAIALGLADPTTATVVVVELIGDGVALVASMGSAPSDSATFSSPLVDGFTVHFSLDALGNAHADVAGVSLDVAVDPAAVAAAPTMYPLGLAYSPAAAGGSGSVVMTRWSYDTGGAGSLGGQPVLIAGGQPTCGLVRRPTGGR
jgi:hypothetical protein